MAGLLGFVSAHALTLIGIIFMIVIGPAVGNYACSVVYRLPRGKTPFERHPYCGDCNADLKPVDLFPILSWISTRGKCRYCAGAIPAIYTVIELTCGAVFISYFLAFGMGEQFLLTTAYATFVVILAAIQWQHGWISATIYSYALACVLLWRTLAEQSLLPTIQSGFLMLMLALLVHALLASRNQRASPFEKPWIWWMVLLGAGTPLSQWPLLAMSALAIFVPRSWSVVVFSVLALALPVSV